ncbi:hypothetical protein BH18ACI4_BH18ACI4_26950 [soil metagenome]
MTGLTLQFPATLLPRNQNLLVRQRTLCYITVSSRLQRAFIDPDSEKRLPTDIASNRDRMERFIREAKSAAALSHPNIACAGRFDDAIREVKKAIAEDPLNVMWRAGRAAALL